MDNTKCIRKNECTSFDINSYQQLCKEINSNCSYDSANHICETITTKKCEDIVFYKENEGNEEFCKSITPSLPYKICSLKEDKSGCEEIYRDSIYPRPGSPTQSDGGDTSSGLMMKDIHILMILLCLLI